jgi:hypothetical protein
LNKNISICHLVGVDPRNYQGLRSLPWLLWKLGTMPNGNYPYHIAFGFIKETVWRYDHLPEGEFWKFGYDSSGLSKVPESSQNRF